MAYLYTLISTSLIDNISKEPHRNLKVDFLSLGDLTIVFKVDNLCGDMSIVVNIDKFRGDLTIVVVAAAEIDAQPDFREPLGACH